MTARTPFRDLNPTQKLAHVVGIVFAAAVGAALAAIVLGLLWRAVEAVWS